MLKIGVIGTGHLGKIHLKLLQDIEGYELAGFYDSDPEVVSSVKEEYDVDAFDSAESLIEAVDVVDIVTPTLFHHHYASLALKSSKHVFIEKPLVNTLKEGKELVELTGEANTKVQVGHVERFNPAFVAAKPFCNNPLFIESHRLAQFNPRGTDVSVVLDLMIHDIDIVLSIIKSNIKRISASGVAVVSDTPDIANARLEFDNGCVANLTASRISMKNMRKSRFFQRDAYISVDFLEKAVEVIRLKQVSGEPDPLAVTMDLGGDKGVKQIYFESPEIGETNAIREELKSLKNSIETNSEPVVSINDGYAALDVAYKVIEKLKAAGDFINSDTI